MAVCQVMYMYGLGYCGEQDRWNITLNDAIGIAIVARVLYSGGGGAKDAILAVHFKAFLASQRQHHALLNEVFSRFVFYQQALAIVQLCA